MHRGLAAVAAVSIVVAAIAARAAAEPLGAPPPCQDHFQAFIEQDGRRTPLAGVVRLDKRPFSLVLRSEDPPAYAVATSLDDRALNTDLGLVFASGHAAAERDGDTTLFINPRGLGADSADWVFQYWYADNVHNRFQRLGTDPDGLIAARKDFGDLSVGRQPPLSLERWTGEAIHLVVTACPPGQTPANPVRATLVFP